MAVEENSLHLQEPIKRLDKFCTVVSKASSFMGDPVCIAATAVVSYC